VSIYLIETGRSYENPIDSFDYQRLYTTDDHPSFSGTDEDGSPYGRIEIEGAGPGSYAFGRDEVYYIGIQNETCIAHCDAERREVYRFYSGRREDHTYWYETAMPDKAPQNPQRYNREPRNGIWAFYLMKNSQTGSQPVYLHYDSSNFNSYFSSSSSGSIELLGYIFTSSSAPSDVLNPNEQTIPLYHYRKNINGHYDDFYTVDPANEVNLQTGVPGVPDPAKPFQQEYQYVGIYGYVLSAFAPRKKKTVIDTGGPQNTGEVDRSSWYSYGSGYDEDDYRDQTLTPAQQGWGDPNNADIISGDANFEWYFGKNGAVKCALPRFLGFHDAFEGQFVYYLYDTEKPFNGPVFGINFTTTDAPCFDGDDYGGVQTPNVQYYSVYYKIRDDAWQTQKTRLTVSAPNADNIADSFWAVGTDDQMVFFRYTSSTGAFLVGETLKGWLITQVRYFGDELRCGYIRLQHKKARNGQEFSYNEVITAQDGATGLVLAGYGIKDKAAFFGVYEFPKRISYFKIKVDNRALIPKRTLDEAIIEATIDEQGRVASAEIINAGLGYINPDVIVSVPDEFKEEGFADTADNVVESFEDGRFAKYNINVETSDEFKTADKAPRALGRKLRDEKFLTDAGFAREIRQAKARITLNEQGAVKTVTITEKGKGYTPGDKVAIYVVEREIEVRADEFIGDPMKGVTEKMNNTFSDPDMPMADTPAYILNENGDKVEVSTNTLFDEGLGTYNSVVGEFDHTVETNIVTSYIEAHDKSDTEKMKFCKDVLPVKCLDLGIGGEWHNLRNYINPSEIFSSAKQYNPNLEKEEEELARIVAEGEETSQIINNRMNNGMVGFLGGDCLEVSQSTLYGVRRFFDIPCPYTELGKDGVSRTFGYLPYKYCGSDRESAQIRVTMEVEGNVIKKGEAINTDFIDFLKTLPKPTLTRPRPTTNTSGKSHACKRGSNVEGKCYSTGKGQYTFVPDSGDENTFDFYGTELEQLETWLGAGNFTGYGAGTATYTVTDPNTGTSVPYTENYNTIQIVACSGGKFPNPCWHNFVTDGVLDVYNAYDSSGNASVTWGANMCTSPPFNNYLLSCEALRSVIFSTIAFDPGAISDVDNNIELAPIGGRLNYTNYLTGATILLDRSLDRFGNPYFEECDLETY
tara:strand:- start:2422 stop:5853 length:3432 start_codon:yes stop_codon:yes gene_type:complete